MFKLAPNGSGGYNETVLHSFANNGTDGYGPLGGLVLDSQGNLYGITVNGGAFGSVGGTIFKITPGGTESVLYNFNSNSLVFSVQPGLVMDSHQNLYGSIGGDGSIYDGLVFQLAPSGVLTILQEFPLSSPVTEHGIGPQGGLLLASNGNLYGTTTSDSVYGSGTVFKLAPSASAVAAPIFSVAPGTYSSAQTITITDATPGATIYYSVNGQIPLSSGVGTLYNGPVTIGSTSVLSAIAIAPDGTSSLPIQANYILGSTP